MIYPVILAGGSGTRLWPLSRERYPKQLLDLVNPTTMLQDTLLRLNKLDNMGPSIVICNDNHRFMVAEQLRHSELKKSTIILEPVGRNTAPAVAVAASKVQQEAPEGILLILPADHFILDVPAFHDALNTGHQFAKQGYLITFGIIPQTPETGYGYILKGQDLEGGKAAVIDRFVEKPDLKTAREYINSGKYCWNSGMFMFNASTVLSEMETHVPDIVKFSKEAMERGNVDLDFFRLDKKAFENCPSDSIDYAIMEKTQKGAMVPFQAGWNDLGSWEALWQVGEKDGADNVIKGDVLVHDVHRSYLHAENRLIAAVGLEEHIVVETADAVLISPRNKVQDVKSLVNKLKASHRAETISHKTTYNPWGTSEELVRSNRFRVNRVTINSGAQLSFHKHYNRAEHWIVVRGTALVLKKDEEIIIKEDYSTYIPPGTAHRLINPGKIPLVVIEVQTGAYLESDDIKRLEDAYGRDKEEGD